MAKLYMVICLFELNEGSGVWEYTPATREFFREKSGAEAFIEHTFKNDDMLGIFKPLIVTVGEGMVRWSSGDEVIFRMEQAVKRMEKAKAEKDKEDAEKKAEKKAEKDKEYAKKRKKHRHRVPARASRRST